MINDSNILITRHGKRRRPYPVSNAQHEVNANPTARFQGPRATSGRGRSAPPRRAIRDGRKSHGDRCDAHIVSSDVVIYFVHQIHDQWQWRI